MKLDLLAEAMRFHRCSLRKGGSATLSVTGKCQRPGGDARYMVIWRHSKQAAAKIKFGH